MLSCHVVKNHASSILLSIPDKNDKNLAYAVVDMKNPDDYTDSSSKIAICL